MWLLWGRRLRRLLLQPRGETAPDVDASGGGVDECDAYQPTLPSIAVSKIAKRPLGGGFAITDQDAAEAKFNVVVIGEKGAEKAGDGWAAMQFMRGRFGVNGSLGKEFGCALRIALAPAIAEGIEELLQFISGHRITPRARPGWRTLDRPE